jgi:hypothetical protein
MIDRRFVVSVLVMFVLFTAFGFLVHGTLLHDDYARLPNLMRTQEDARGYFGYMLVADLLMAIGATWIYRQGRQERPWLGQGLRFGVALCLLLTIPMYLIYFAVMPFPSDLVAQQIVFGSITTVISGIVLAWINR